MYFPVDACGDGLNLSLLAISSLLSLENRSMLIGIGITTSSTLSTHLAYRQMHSLAAGMLSTRASPGGYCLLFLEVSTSVGKKWADWFLTTLGLWFEELLSESVSTFSTVAALGTEKPLG